jgi:hypothetical protein
MKITMNDHIMVLRSIQPDRRQFIGGSDARIIMGPDEVALIRLCQARPSRRVYRRISSSNWGRQGQYANRSGLWHIRTQDKHRYSPIPRGWVGFLALVSRRRPLLRSFRR